MSTVKVPPPTITYTPVGRDVMASVKNSKHTLLWERRSGAVYRDSDRRPLYYHLTEDIFHAQAESLFGSRHLDSRHTNTARDCARRGVVRATCVVDGAGWQARCGCGHYGTGWQPTWWRARRALTAHITKTRAEAAAVRLDLAAIKRAGVRVPQQRSAS